MNLQKCQAVASQENSLGREAGGEGVSNMNTAQLLPNPKVSKFLDGLGLYTGSGFH
jgi:hypothetical protein